MTATEANRPDTTRVDPTSTGAAPTERTSSPVAPSTFLGIPAPRGVGHLRGDQSFPDAARTALRDGQLRANLGHATSTIRGKRARVVADCRTGRSCARRAGRSRQPPWPGWTSTWRSSNGR